ncbi:hypothetical protein [Bradyrhizobium oligotrophicum]|uniref:hypothetical protein n=1 Tax=Bradyrhizobium oligotrophicum TaxID=44255 RepID=UPI003EBE688F
MNFDLQTFSVLTGVASAVVGLAYKLMPRSVDRLKRDLELLKLAREAKANFLPLQRHVDAQINEAYLSKGVGFKRSFDIAFGNVVFAIMITTPITGIIGAGIAFGSKYLFALSDNAVNSIGVGFLMLGILGGIIGGGDLAKKDLADARKEIEERERMLAAADEEELRRFRATNSPSSKGEASTDNSAPDEAETSAYDSLETGGETPTPPAPSSRQAPEVDVDRDSDLKVRSA